MAFLPTTTSTTSGSYICSTCGWLCNSSELHICPGSSTGGGYTSPINTIPNNARITMKGIHWHEYTPAKPPISDEYLVVTFDPSSNKREITKAAFNADKLSWTTKLIVTHYVKLELP